MKEGHGLCPWTPRKGGAVRRGKIGRLKRLKGRPLIKPSGMANATGPKRPGKRGKRCGRGKVTPRVAVETQG